MALDKPWRVRGFVFLVLLFSGTAFGGGVVSVERLDLTLTDDLDTTVSVNLTKGQDVTNCVPFATRQKTSVTSNANSDDYTAPAVDVEMFDNARTAAVRVTRSNAIDESRVTVSVVEFDSDVNVQQAFPGRESCN